jgi:hypothetical protein
MKLQDILQDHGDNLSSVAFWDEMRGAAPGGTFATIFNAVDGKSHKPPRVDFDPFLRLPDGSKSKHVCKANLPSLPAKSNSPWESPVRQWTTPFVMALVNSQVVRWSYALRSQGSASITYKEYALNPDFKTAFVNYAGMAMVGSMLFNPITSYVMQNYLIPKPGEGPSLEAMEDKREFLKSDDCNARDLHILTFAMSFCFVRFSLRER